MRIAAVSLAVTAALVTAACSGDDKSASQSASDVMASGSAAVSSASAAVTSATAAVGSAIASATASPTPTSTDTAAPTPTSTDTASPTAGATGAAPLNSVRVTIGTDAPVDFKTQNCSFFEGVGLSYAGQAAGMQLVMTQAGTRPATVAILGGPATGSDTNATVETKSDGTFTGTATLADKPVTFEGHCDALVGKGGQ